MIVRLPLPPSTNGLYFNVPGRGRRKMSRYRAWLAEADNWLLTQKRNLRKVSGPCDIVIRIPANTCGDVSNRIKAAEDYLVSRELTDDDKHNRSVKVEFGEELDCCEVIITSPAETVRAGEG